jgi:hypothetical protein
MPRNISGLKPFPKGVSGNPGGRPKEGLSNMATNLRPASSINDLRFRQLIQKGKQWRSTKQTSISSQE